MRKTLMAIVLMTGFLDAGWVRVIGSSDTAIPPKKEVIRSDLSGVIIRTTMFGFTEEDTTVDTKDFKRIEIPEEQVDRDTTRAGKPQIPYIRLLIAVPDSCEFNITAYESDHILFEDYLLYPVPRVVFEEDTFGCVYSKEVYTYDTSFYEKDTLYPDKFYEVISDGHWRGQRVLEVFLYPVQCNPQQKLVYFYDGLVLRIEYTGTVVENENGLGPFEDIGREVLLNYPGVDRELPSRDPPAVHYYTDLLNTDNVADYIIVTHEDILGIDADSLKIHEFGEWRVRHNGFDVGIVKMVNIYDGFLPPGTADSAKALRDFLVYAYDNWNAPSVTDEHFAYCLFIGDWDYVPTRLYLDPYNWLAADERYFRDLVPGSNDDIMLGRWPVRPVTHDLLTIANKTINYEQSPETGDWRRRGLLIAGENSILHTDTYVDSSKPYFSDIGYDTLTVRRSELASGEAYRDSITMYLNHGEILSVYYGHGNKAEWSEYSYTNLLDLENGSRLPVVLSMACLTGSFQWAGDQKCFGEHFIFKAGGGCIAFYGATRITTGASFRSALGFLSRMLRHQYWILGECLIDHAWAMHYCLLGDPALDLGDYATYPDSPDLVVRPQGIDISLLPPYPYPRSGDIIPIRAKVHNIGGAVARTVDVNFSVILDHDTLCDSAVTIEEIQPRGSAVTTVYWNTSLSHPNYYGEIGDCDFVVTADPDNIIEESWEFNNTSAITRKVALYPSESNWPKTVTGFSQPAIADLDGTGSVEIVYASLDSVYVYEPNGSVISSWPKYFKEVYGVVLGDIDNNDTIDIVAVSPESIKVYDYQGSILDGWPIHIEEDDYEFVGLPALGRIESSVSDVFNVVIAARQEPELPSIPAPMKVFVYDRQGSGVYEFNTTSQVSRGTSYGVSIADIVSAGNDEIAISYSDEASLLVMMTDVFNCNGLVTTLNYGSGRMISALVDLDDPPDGYAEMVVGCVDDTVRAYKATTGDILWKTNTGGSINSSPAVGDINPTAPFRGDEIALGNDLMEIWAIRGNLGTPWGLWPLDVGGKIRSSAALAQIDTIQGLEILIGSDDQYLYSFNWDADTIHPYPLPLFDVFSSPVVGDIDGDRKSEVILSSRDGYLHVWENMNSEVSSYLLEWPQFHHDYQRTGLYGW